MKILCLSDAFWPDHTGGISKSLITKIEGLVELGNDVTVVCRRLLDTHPGLEERSDYRIYRYASPPRGSALYRLYPLWSMLALPKLLQRLAGQQTFDVAYTNDLFQVSGLRRALPQLPYVHNYHASAVSEIRLDASRGKYGLLSFSPVLDTATYAIARLERSSLICADRIIVDSGFMGDDLRKEYHGVSENRIRRVPLPVDTQRFAPAHDRVAVRDLLGLPREGPILLTVRRLVARMGLDNLVAAMRQVVQKFPHVLLLMGGTGYLSEHLKRTILGENLEHNVRMLGFIPEALLPAYYQAADFFILPTLEYEGFGLVTIEALACGTPVLGTPVGATPEILGSLNEELLFRDSSAQAIALGINNWLVSTVGAEVRQQCRAYCVRRFDKPKISQRIEQILAESTGMDSAIGRQHSLPNTCPDAQPNEH
jgi:glycosyltransferase involved in cell wall biosynthesis